MMRLHASLAALLLVAAGCLVAVTILPGVARAATLYVGGSGPGNYTTIGAGIAAANTGDTVFVYSGTYTENTITLGKTISLVGESRAATIIDGGQLYLTAPWANVSGFTFRGRGGFWAIRAHFATDCRIEGNGISGYTYGILLNSSTRITLTNNAFTGTGVYINGMNGGSYLVDHWNSHTIGTSNTVNGKPIVYWSNLAGGTIPVGAGQVLLASVTGVTVQGQSLANASVGVEVGFSSDVRVSGNNVSGNAADGIRLHYSTSSQIESNNVTRNGEGIAVWGSQNNRIANNTVTGNALGGITITASRDTLVAGNNLSANVGSGILVEPSGSGVTLRDNSITGSAQGIFSYDPVTIVNNTVFGNANGIDVVGAGSAVVFNRVSRNTGRGIMVEIQGNVWVANNNVSGNGVGIQLYQTANNMILGNIVTNNHDGIFSGSGTSQNTVDNNTVTGNEYGITLDLSTGDTVLRNDVSGNLQGGITVGFSALPVLRNNHVAGNARFGSYGGIYLESTTGARVFHNAIVVNMIQAHDTGTNAWDDGYPSGGNYWSDYTGVDNCSGPNQNTCPSPDGIGDTPYSFPVSARDRYPLMASPTSQPTRPSAPWNVRAVRGDHSVTLMWSAPLDDGGSPITNYRIYGGTASGSEAFLLQLGNVTTYTDSGLSNGVTYYYQVSAKNVVGEGPRSSEVSATPATVPGPPSTLQATPGVQRITLAWGAPADNGGSAVTGYRIWRGITSGGEVVLTAVGNVLTYLDTGVSVGTTYYYQVSAVNAVGDGPRSTEAYATPTSPANQPPRCVVTTPASGDHVSGVYPVTGNSTDPDGSAVRVEVRVDGGTWDNATGTSSWRYDWDTRSVPNGPHTIHARSYDGTNYSSIVDVNVTVDNGLPPPQSVFAEGWFWGLLGLVVLVTTLLMFVLWRERRTKRPPEPAP